VIAAATAGGGHRENITVVSVCWADGAQTVYRLYRLFFIRLFFARRIAASHRIIAHLFASRWYRRGGCTTCACTFRVPDKFF